jgi:hypothetical protein
MICPCGSCLAVIDADQQSMLCRGVCNRNFHIQCTGITVKLVTKLLRKRSRWRKNSALSPSRARKLARSRLPQPRPPNPPRNPCFFRPTIPGLRAEPSSPTAPAASRRLRAVPPWRGRGNKKDRAEPAEDIPIPIPIPIIHLTLLVPAPNRLRFRPPTSGPFAPLVSEPGHPAHPLSPARSLP